MRTRRARLAWGVAGAVGAAGVAAASGLAALGSTIPVAHDVAGPDTTVAAPALTPDDPAAVALLTRAVHASASASYEALARSSADSTTVRIDRLAGMGTVVTRSGQPAYLVLAGQSTAGPGAIAVAGPYLGLLTDNYRVLRETAHDQLVAGRPAAAVDVVRADRTRAATIWIDRATSVLTRRDLFDDAGDTLVDSSAYERFTPRLTGMNHLPPIASAGSATALKPDDLADRTRAGCTCAKTLPGGYRLLDAQASASGATHLLYGDGLRTMSVFDEPGTLERPSLQAEGFAGARVGDTFVAARVSVVEGVRTGEWVWQSGPSVLTLVLDCADEADGAQEAAPVVAALSRPPVPSHLGQLTAAVGRGWGAVTEGISLIWDFLTVHSADSHDSMVN